MRPTPSEIIDGVRRILREVVAPEVSSGYAADQLRQILLVLGQVDWDEAAHLVRKENAAMRDALIAVHAWMTDDDARRHAMTLCATPIESAVGEMGEEPSFAADNATNLRLRGAMTDAIDALSAWTAAQNGDGADQLALLWHVAARRS